MERVEIGRRYRKVSVPWIVWEVVGRLTDGAGIPHVRLASVRDPTRVILIAESVVLRAGFFARVAPG